MTAIHPTLPILRPDPPWSELPLFDRTGWTRMAFEDLVENGNETERNLEAVGIGRFIA